MWLHVRKAGSKCAGLVRGVKRLIPKWVAPALFAVALTLAVKAYYKPQLSAEVAVSDLVSYSVDDKGSQFVLYLVDRFPSGQARIISPKKITFKSRDDVQQTGDYLQIIKILLSNLGRAASKNVRAGIGVPDGWHLVTSSNVKVVTEAETESAGDHPAYKIVEIPSLAAGEAAVITLTHTCGCGSAEGSAGSGEGKLFLATQEPGRGFRPLLFLVDEEGSAADATAASMKEVLDLEQGYFPGNTTGFWAEGINVKQGATSPTVDSIEHFEVKVQEGKDGQQVTLTTDRTVPFD